jgi:hypothetical protein
MSDPVLAAIIAALATLVATVMQLRASFAREVAARAASGSSRRKSRVPTTMLVLVLLASASGGFALSHWLTADERIAKTELQKELQARISELDRTASELAQTRSGVRADHEAERLREIGIAGVVSFAAVGPCRPASTQAASAGAADASASCTEAEATTVTLCTPIPATATVSEVELYTRAADATTPWSAARAQPGQEVDRARFAPTTTETPDGDSTKLVCEAFSHWASDHARVARMVVHYRI